MSSLISAVAWVRRGVAAADPKQYVLDDAELARVSKLAGINPEDAREEFERAQKASASMSNRDDIELEDEGEDSEWIDEDDSMEVDKPAKEEDGLAAYNLDEYDEEEGNADTGPFSNIKGLTYYRTNEEDPYITLKEDDDDDELEELRITPTDNLLVTAKTENNVSELEVYIYDDEQENLYAHHNFMLPNFPLCLEWLDFRPGSFATDPNTSTFGNYIAAGTLDPEIEIWSLDIVNAMYPDAVLGRPSETAAHVPVALGTGKKKRKKEKHRQVTDEYHVDAVLSLSWNKTHRNLLASASADRTVKLWDLSRPDGAIRSFNKIHKDKVQAVKWNQKEPTVLLTGGYDRQVKTFDSRAIEAGVGVVVGSDVEALAWDPWAPHSFLVSLENGMVVAFDARTLSGTSDSGKAMWTLDAHNGAASALDISSTVKGCIVTGGTDKLVKLWHVLTEDSGKSAVSMVASMDLGVGKVFSSVFSPDDPLVIAAAGSVGSLQIWDTGAQRGVRSAFGLARQDRQRERGGVIGVVSDGEASEGEEAD